MGFLRSGSVSDWALQSSLAVLLLCLAVAVGRVVEWIWWRPKRLERLLREQGVKGNPYRLPVGDVGDLISIVKTASSKPLPLFCHDIAPRVLPFFSHILKKYGKNSLIWFGPHPGMIVTNPEQIREILSTKSEHFEKLSLGNGKLFPSGLAHYEGEKWAMHRRIVNPAFHLEKLKCMLPTVSTCCGNLIDRWKELVSSDVYTELNVWPEFQHFTGDIISQTAFGSYYEEGKRVFQLQSEQARLFAESLSYFFIPGYSYIPTRANRRKVEVEKEVRSLLRAIIEKREKAMKGGAKSEDLLGYLMDSNFNYSQASGSAGIPPGMTIDEVIDECKLFYFAGQETTAVLLTWTLILLCMYPNWQARAREEALQHFGKKKPNFDELNHLKIVTMIITEVLRLYPPAPVLSRCASKDIKIGNINLQRGAQMFLPILFIHHDPEYWGEDVLEFKPERFSEGVSKAVKSRMAFFPFGGGPRVCIGQGFAMIEAKLALCIILQNFCFELSPSYIHAPHSVVTLHPQHGAPIMIKKL